MEDDLSNPRFVFNAVTLDFPHPLTGYEYRRRSARDLGISTGGVSSTGLHHQYDWFRAALEHFEDETFEARLWAWWSWAVRGKQFSFALDSAEAVDTTLDGTAAAGQKVIPLTSTTGITAGNRYLVREATGEEEELIQVDTISAGVSVTAIDNLVYGYASGDLFRSRDFFPKLVVLGDDRPWIQLLTNFSLVFEAREDKG